MEDEKTLPQNEGSPKEEKPKSMLQLQKENWYDKVNLNVKQLDTIITVGLILLALTFVVIFLDAADIFNPFGY